MKPGQFLTSSARTIGRILANHPDKRWTAAELTEFSGLHPWNVNDAIAVLRRNKAIGRRKIKGVFGAYSYKIRRKKHKQAVLPGILEPLNRFE
jgi:hypothetical protein